MLNSKCGDDKTKYRGKLTNKSFDLCVTMMENNRYRSVDFNSQKGMDPFF